MSGPAGPAGAAGRAARRQAIRDAIARNEVHSHAELQALLEAEGIRVPQATLSRDLRTLGARKTEDGYRVEPGLAEDRGRRRRLRRELRGLVVGAERSGPQLVVEVEEGRETTVARALLAARLPEVLGVVPGLGCVLVATPGAGPATALRSALAGDA